MSKITSDAAVLVVGATLAAVGIAESRKTDVLVVEKTSLVGSEFIDCLHPGTGWNDARLSAKGEKLKKELLKRNILSGDGRVHIPALAPVLFELIKTENLKFLFMTAVTEILRVDGGFDITLLNNSGFQKIRVKTIIDTTACGVSLHEKPYIPAFKSLNAALSPAGESFGIPTSSSKAVSFEQGRFDSEFYMKLRLDPKDSWSDARTKLFNFWSRRGDELADWNIASVASTFECSAKPGPAIVEEGWRRFPSCACANALEAYEAGLSCLCTGC